jgi:zinc transport system substrate-binding protein
MPKKNLTIIIGLVFLAAIAFLIIFNFQKSPAGTPGAPEQSGQIKVVTSFYPLYFFAQQIGGERAEVLNITPAGAEPHDYEPTAKDMAAIEDSRLLILNGGGLEPWAADIRDNINLERTKILVVGDGLAVKKIAEDGKNLTDPHIWLSPPLAAQMVDKIVAGFTAVDAANQDYYLANAERLKKELSALDQAYQGGLSRCAKKEIITAHAAFAYLAATYNLQQMPIAGLAPEAEPSPREMADIVKLARDRQVKYIFFESLVSPKLADTIAAEVGAQTLVLNPLEGLTPAEISAGQDYFTEMRNNLINLQIALECQK